MNSIPLNSTLTKPCPFCGHSETLHLVAKTESGRVHVKCSFCEALGPAGYTQQQAEAKWHNRAQAIGTERSAAQRALERMRYLADDYGSKAASPDLDENSRKYWSNSVADTRHCIKILEEELCKRA